MTNKKRIVSLATATAMMLGSYASTFAMPDLFRVTQSNGTVIQYSMNEAIDTPVLYQRMMDNIAEAFQNDRDIVGELLSGKLVDVDQALTTGNYDNYETEVKEGTINQAVDITATHDGVVGDDGTVSVKPREDDTEAPVINYTGDTTVELENGAEYAAPAVEVTDNVDTGITATRVITNAGGDVLTAIDTTVAGTYTITYSAKDAAGNEAEDLVITVVVAEVKQELKVESVSAINATGVTVEYTTLTVDMLGKTVEVKDSKGDVYAVKSADLAEGSKSYTFEFVTTVATAKLVGNWTVNGVAFNLDLAINLKAFNDAGTDQIKLNKALTDLGIKNVKVENMNAYASGHGAFLTKLAEDATDLSVANIQGFVDKVNSEQITAGEGTIVVKAINDAITAGNDIALLQALQNPAFVRVNADWLTGVGSYKLAIESEATLANKDEVKEIQAFIDGVNDAKATAVTKTGIDKEVLLKSKDLVTTYSTPDTKGEQTVATKTLLKEINVQLALVDVLEATTPNNFKAKLATLATLADVAELKMTNYVDANGAAYIKALKDETDTTKKDTAKLVGEILFKANSGVNDQVGLTQLAKVKIAADAAKTSSTTATQAELIKELKALGIKQVSTENKVEYAKAGGTNIELLVTASASGGGSKAKVQEAVDKINVLAVKDATENTIIDKLNVFGLDNIVAANVKAYHTAASTIGGITADNTGDNAKTVALVKAEVKTVNDSAKVDALVKVIEESTDVAETKQALVDLANLGKAANFLNTPTADRDFVAEELVAIEDREDLDTEGKINTAVGNANTIITDALTAVNALDESTTSGAIELALDKVKVFKELTPIAKKDVASAFRTEIIEKSLDLAGDFKALNYKSYTAITNVIKSLIK